MSFLPIDCLLGSWEFVFRAFLSLIKILLLFEDWVLPGQIALFYSGRFPLCLAAIQKAFQ